MSLTYAEVHHLYHEMKPLIIGAICTRFASLSPCSFVVRLERKNFDPLNLFFCFKEPFLRFHFSQNFTKSIQNTPFVETLFKKLGHKEIVDCVLLNEDRILSLCFQGHERMYLVAELIPKHANCYLLNSNQLIMAALNPVGVSVYVPPVKPEFLCRELQEIQGNGTSFEIEKKYSRLEKQHVFVQQKKNIAKQLEKGFKRAQKRFEERLKMLNRCKEWKKVRHEGLLLQANLFRITKGMHEIIVSDWEQEGEERTLHLDSLVSPKDQLASYFRRSKKLNIGQGHAKRLLQLAEEELALYLEKKDVLNGITDSQSLEEYCKRFRIDDNPTQVNPLYKKKEPVKPYNTFITREGVEIWVGKNAADNDKLTLHFAKGSDLWLHARNYPGSHVVVRCLKGQELDENSLNDAAELALRYSKAKDTTEGEVCLAQVKTLTRVKEKPGKVILSKHKVLCVILDDKRWHRLKMSLKTQLAH